MYEIFLPERILFGDDSIQRYAQSDFESVLIISDKTSEKEREFIEKIQELFDTKTPKTEKIFNNDFCGLYSDTIKYISENEVDRIVAAGSARLIDTAMMISYQSGVAFAAAPFAPAIPDEEDEFPVVKKKKFNVRPMDVQEAIMQMNLLNHDFFVFRDADTETVSVVYRRSDGKYGLIESEY